MSNIALSVAQNPISNENPVMPPDRASASHVGSERCWFHTTGVDRTFATSSSKPITW